jgi:hypothetical protein
MGDKGWIHEPMRIIALQNEGSVYNPALLDDYDTTLDFWKQNGFNVEQCKHVIGRLYDPDKHHDVLKEYAQKAAERNIKLILYYNVHVIIRAVGEEHPDWIAVDKEQHPIIRYEIDYGVCINSSWREYILRGLSSLKDIPLGGIFLDGPVYWDEGCFCPVCRQKFQEQSGTEMETARHAERQEFAVQSVVNFVKHFREAYLQVHPGGIVYMNNRGMHPTSGGRNIYRVKPYLDMLGTEGGFIYYGAPNETPLWKTGSSAKYLEAVDKEMPRVIFCAADHKPWSFYLHTEAETKLMFASANANGSSVWYGFHSPLIFEGMNYFETPGGGAAAMFAKYLDKNADYYRNTVSAANTAIVWSQDSADFYGGSLEETDFTEEGSRGKDKVRGNHSRSFHGFYEMLFRSGICFDIITDKTLRDKIHEKYRTIIMPNCACLSDEAGANINEWCRNGGTVIASAETSLYHPDGTRRNDFELSSLFGISWTGTYTEYTAGVAYFDADPGEFPETLNQNRMLPMSGYAPDISTGPEPRTWAYWREPMEARYAPPKGRSGPAACIKETGSGKAVYFSGNIGEAYTKYGIYDYQKLISGFLQKHSLQPVEIDAPSETVEVILRHQPDKNRYLLHLINFTGSMRRPVTGFIPLKNINITLRLTSVRTAVSLRTGKTIPAEQNGVKTVLTLTELTDYEVLVLQ